MRRKRHLSEEQVPEELGSPQDEAPTRVEEDEFLIDDKCVEESSQRIADLEAALAERSDEYLRAVAEQRNIRRRSDEHRLEQVQYANREFALALLPALDDFDRALAAADKNQSFEALIEGILMTQRKLQISLEKAGVQAIDVVGKEFDPNFHDAVMTDNSGENPENSVVEELQRGYTMHGRVLRPSMVKVAQS